jgi:hypothetical protein
MVDLEIIWWKVIPVSVPIVLGKNSQHTKDLDILFMNAIKIVIIHLIIIV